jgi:hypothetical protein
MKITYQLLANKAASYSKNRFSGRHVEGNSVKTESIKKRERRLRKIGLSVLMFQS